MLLSNFITCAIFICLKCPAITIVDPIPASLRISLMQKHVCYLFHSLLCNGQPMLLTGIMTDSHIRFLFLFREKNTSSKYFLLFTDAFHIFILVFLVVVFSNIWWIEGAKLFVKNESEIVAAKHLHYSAGQHRTRQNMYVCLHVLLKIKLWFPKMFTAEIWSITKGYCLPGSLII